MTDRPTDRAPESALFNADAVEEIRRISRLSEAELVILIGAFEDIGQHFRQIILATPTSFALGPEDVSGNERCKWLEDNALRHVESLLDAMGKQEMFAPYPLQGSNELSEDEWAALRTGLARLHAYVRSLQDDIEGRIGDRSTINAELRFDLVSRLAAACHNAGIPIARNYVVGKGDKSVASKIIGRACELITGTGFSIDHHLRDVVKLAKAEKHR